MAPMNIKLAFLLPKLLLLTKSAILVFLLSMMQPQHGFSSIEGEETEENNPRALNPSKSLTVMVTSLLVGVLKEMVMVSFCMPTVLILIPLQVMCMYPMTIKIAYKSLTAMATL
jgi:hypothetical protein